MTKRVALILYFACWAAVSAGIIFALTDAGSPLWLAVGAAYLLFMVFNGSMAYRVRVRKLRLEGQEAPPYLQYLLFPKGAPPSFNKEVPWPVQALVGVVVAIAGLFLLYCGVALAYSAEWSSIDHPVIAMIICLVVAGIGAALLYLAWRLFVFRRYSKQAT